MTRLTRPFRREESGTITIFGLFLFVVACCLGGLALDVSHAYKMRTQLQITADSAAHAALVRRQRFDEDTAIAAAMDVVESMMPFETHGDVVLPEDIVFGTWDAATRTFTPVENATQAVQIDTHRIAQRSNAAQNFLLRLIDVDGWDIIRRSIFATYAPDCLNEGFVAEEYVDVTSNNIFRAGFCVHANHYVELNNNNLLELGVVVSMPNRHDLVIPAAGMRQNDGLEEALRDAYYDLGVPARVTEAYDDATIPGATNFPDFITSTIEVPLNRRDPVDETVWVEGRIHRVTCARENQRIRIPQDTVLRNGVLVTNCEVAFGSNAAVENFRLVTTSTSVDSITGASGIRMGDPESPCAPGGEVIFATRGGMRVPQGLEMYGSRVIAEGDVSFTAAINGIGGSSILAGGHIRGTANGEVGICHGVGLPPGSERRYYQMVL
ncbi:hypothetical protein HKCCE3408_14430 [Rhodobacterales bacterium HKCCE3408]|nr:hypothetical protein [Rhodobacterales bacterium HKCCE3408]